MWIRGSFGRATSVHVDGREIGAAGEADPRREAQLAVDAEGARGEVRAEDVAPAVLRVEHRLGHLVAVISGRPFDEWLAR